MAASGLGNGKIVAKLVEQGASAPGRKGWSKQVIRTLLSNRRYIGEVVYGRTEPLKRGGQKKRQVVQDVSKWTMTSG
jgi:Recombinase